MKKCLKNLMDPSDKEITIDVLTDWLNSLTRCFRVSVREYEDYYRLKVMFLPHKEYVICKCCETFEDLLEELYCVFFALKQSAAAEEVLLD